MNIKRTRSRAYSRAVRALALGLLIPAGLAAQTTGFNQTAAGPFDYNDTANWVGENANGIWDVSLTLTANQTVTFDADTELTSGLVFNYTGGQNVTLRGNGGDYTMTLGGDLVHNTASANRTITIGSTTSNQNLNIDLDGASRTFTVGGAAGNNNIRTLTLQNNVINGGLTVNGGGNVNLNGTANTLGSLRLQNTNLRLNGVSGANSTTSVSGALTIDGHSTNGGAAIVTLTPNNNRNLALTASELVRENKGVVFFRGNNLGGTLGANGTANVTFTNAPDLVGGGGSANTTNVSILAWGVGGSTASSNANTFVTYDPTNGIRTLDLDTEFVVLDSSHEGSIGHTDNNVRTTVGSNVTLAGDNTVNSLIVGDSSAGNTVLAGDGTLTVTSGAVLLQRGTISLDLDFGDAEGVIGFTQGQSTTISGSFAGTNGLTLYQPNTNAANFSAGNGVTINGNAANSTYSGDTHILGRASINVNGFLPYDTRTGDIYVHGIMDIGTSATMNGLNGSGNVSKAFSGAATFTIGDNNANGNFTGILSNNGALTVRKIGTGTQTFGGANTYTGGTLVDAGTFLITNTEGSGTGTGDVSVASGARFGGTGIATGHVTLAAADSVIIAGGVSSIGTLNLLGGLTATNGATFDFDINGASADSVNFGDGNVTLGDVVTVNLNLSGPIQTGVAYTLFTGTGGTWTDESSLVINLLGSSNYVLDTTYGDGDGYIFDADNHSFSVQLAAVPEPSTYALLGGLGVLLFAARRKMRAHRAA